MVKQSVAKPAENTQMQASPLWEKLGDVNQSVSIELGRTEISLRSALELSEGSLIELDRTSGEGVEVYVNGVPFFRGEVVTIGENFGVRIIEIIEED